MIIIISNTNLSNTTIHLKSRCYELQLNRRRLIYVPFVTRNATPDLHTSPVSKYLTVY